MKMVFMGTPEFSVTVLEGLLKEKKFEIVGVVSQPDKKVGRKQEIMETPVSLFARNNNIPVLKINNIREEYQEVLKLEPDIIITCAYGQIIPIEILNYPKYGCINVHASLLPKYRGGSPIEYAIMKGEKETGITIMYMDEKMDNGDIITQRSLEILNSDNLETLTKKLSVLGRDLLIDTLPAIINGKNNRIKQDETKVSYAYNLKKSECHLDFNDSAINIFNKIRALSPKPCVFCTIKNKNVKIYNGYLTKDKSTNNPGVIEKIYNDGIGVSTKDYIYVITELQIEGKKKMKAADYIRGIHENLIGEKYE